MRNIYSNLRDIYGERGKVINIDEDEYIEIELNNDDFMDTITIRKGDVDVTQCPLLNEDHQPKKIEAKKVSNKKVCKEKVSEEKVVTKLKISNKKQMPKVFRLAIYAAEVVLVWKLVNNSEQIVMFLVNHFIK
jgi:hypothetical protein